MFNRYNYAHDPGYSYYPFILRVHLFSLVLSIVRWFIGGSFFFTFYIIFFLFFIAFVWGKRVYLEGVAGFHSSFVRHGFILGFCLFIFSEVIFFVSVFWVYLDASLVPSFYLGGVWPPMGLLSPRPFGLPLFGTFLLLLRGACLTWCHSSLLTNCSGFFGLFLTLCCAISFLFVQFLEYFSLRFSIRDSVYGSVFYFGTGFHGIHVLVGAIFLVYCWYWVSAGSCSPVVHVGFSCAVLYWHFVDVVWLFLYFLMYVWGGLS